MLQQLQHLGPSMATPLKPKHRASIQLLQQALLSSSSSKKKRKSKDATKNNSGEDDEDEDEEDEDDLFAGVDSNSRRTSSANSASKRNNSSSSNNNDQSSASPSSRTNGSSVRGLAVEDVPEEFVYSKHWRDCFNSFVGKVRRRYNIHAKIAGFRTKLLVRILKLLLH